MDMRPLERQMKDQITIHGHEGSFRAYVATPEALPAPAVVVLQELFGVNADTRKHCDELAEQGFLAVAPDLFWRQEPGVDLSVTSEPDWQHGLRLYQAYDRDVGARDERGSRAKLLTSELCASAGLDFLNDLVRNCYFCEEVAENLQVSSGCERKHRTGVDYQVTRARHGARRPPGPQGASRSSLHLAPRVA
jgi:hypothetical protein